MEEPQEIPVVMLAGPTASGKSALAMALAEDFECEIISMDSAQVYRGMDIGTAKPTAADQGRVPHHLLDILDPGESYSAARFRDDAQRLIRGIRSRQRIPLIVGGTMLYARALVEGLSDLPTARPEVRDEISAEAQQLGWPAMHARLAEIDPLIGQRIHPNDAQRIQRALEVHASTGQAPSTLQGAREGGVTGPLHRFALDVLVRSELHARIEQRFRAMMQAGFLEEVQRLRARGDLHLDMPAMRCVGYRQLWQHLDGQYDLEEGVYRGIVATRQLAKRQLTWMRGDTGLQRLDAADPVAALSAIKTVLTE